MSKQISVPQLRQHKNEMDMHLLSCEI